MAPSCGIAKESYISRATTLLLHSRGGKWA
jgi:hypothetical protein